MSEEIRFIPDEDLQVVGVPITALSQVVDWGHSHCNIDSAWKMSKGSGVKVAVLDSGIASHPDLEGSYVQAYNCSDCDSPEDKQCGHGTHVAGIIGARDNQLGVVGVAPECELIPIKVLGDNGSGSYSSIITGINKAMELNADIINMSLGSSSAPPEALHNVIKQAAARGIIIIAAAGNDAGSVNFPARYEEVIAVAAINKDGSFAKFTSHDGTVDAVAPGVDIYSTFLKQSYAIMSGTSQASPFMAGVAALVLSYTRTNPNTPQIHNYIDMMKALDLVSDDSTYISPNVTKEWGFGVPKFANVDWTNL